MSVLSRKEARAFYDWFGTKQDAQAYYEDPAIDDLIAYGYFEDARTVYELGCGTGRLAERLLEHELPLSASYRGTDISARMVELARARLDRFEERAQVVQTQGAMEIASPDGSVNHIVSTYVLDLLSEGDIQAFLEEAQRALTWDGRLCLAGLTHGTTLLSRLVTWVWRVIHWIHPRLVGGCKPVKLTEFLRQEYWTVLHHRVVVAYGIPSEVVVASPRARRVGSDRVAVA